jgi:cytochrome c peroxidase
MAQTTSHPILHVIRRLASKERMLQMSDQDLLQQFQEHKDEAAFASLVHRHGGMVWGVCRGLLRNEADAEDAFQATFLVLAGKANSIRKSAALACWLHGVAHRISLDARSRSACRQRNEIARPGREAFESDDLSWREVQQVLHEELAGLDERYRGPLVICYLEGKTQDQAADQLGVAKSTVKEWLERGRALLRARLVRRGLGSTAILAAATLPTFASEFVPAGLASNAAKAATSLAVAPANVTALTRGMLETFSLTKLKMVSVILLCIASLAAGGGLLGLSQPAAPAAARTRTTSMPSDDSKSNLQNRVSARKITLPEKPFTYANLDLPAHFKTSAANRFDNTPKDNPVTDHGSTLGRVLFYDTRLSANHTVSCSSCHVQKHAFTDPERFSKGFQGERTDRHAMTLVNLRYVRQARFFWDQRAGNLEAMVLLPIQSKLEMGQDLTRLVDALGQDGDYTNLFKNAFGDPAVTKERIGKALAQFVRSMVSYQSKFDEGASKANSVRDEFANFTVQENRGKALFLRNCAICHMPEGQSAHFSMVAPANTGLDADAITGDGGVGEMTLNPRQLGQFKPPSLRNVEVTAPYMHDGRFDALEKVIDHYSDGVKPHPNLDPRVEKLNYTPEQKAELLAFLKTLTDRKFLTDPKFADPFQ